MFHTIISRHCLQSKMVNRTKKIFVVFCPRLPYYNTSLIDSRFVSYDHFSDENVIHTPLPPLLPPPLPSDVYKVSRLLQICKLFSTHH